MLFPHLLPFLLDNITLATAGLRIENHKTHL